jgi:hypothetical protein
MILTETLTCFVILIPLILFDYKPISYSIYFTVVKPYFSIDEAVEMKDGGLPLKALYESQAIGKHTTTFLLDNLVFGSCPLIVTKT